MFETINPFIMLFSSSPKIVQHVYQKSAHGEIIFYSSRDAIVYFTILCVCARMYGIRPIMLCLMADHIHGLYPVKERKSLSAFVRECTKRFAFEFNTDSNRSGQLFKQCFGSAAKVGGKQIRSINAYVANNPVEKRLCFRAEEYRWNFLAYFASRNPFSEKLVLRKSGAEMRKAFSIIRDMRNRDLPVNYRTYDRITEKLCRTEKQQLIDYIINNYNVIDYECLLSSYTSYEGMLDAFANTKGAEYDIEEEFDSYSNRNYGRMTAYLKEKGNLVEPKEVIRLPIDKRRAFAKLLISRGGFSEYQVRKYLHLCVESK